MGWSSCRFQHKWPQLKILRRAFFFVCKTKGNCCERGYRYFFNGEEIARRERICGQGVSGDSRNPLLN